MIKERDDLTLTWRDVFDSKVVDQSQIFAARIAKGCLYRYMNFNGRVLDVTGDYPTDTGLTVEDIK